MMDSVLEWAESLVDALGYGGVAFLVALENLFPPIPSEVVLPLAGFVAASGSESAMAMIAAATVGSMIGAYALYAVSAAIGPVRLRTLVSRHGRWLGLTEEDLDRSEQWFDSRARSIVLISRCIPLMRSLISIPAGFRRMPLIPFTMYTLAGSLIWNIGLVGAGYLLGDNWRRAGEPVEVLQNAVVVLIIVALGWFIWRRILRARRER